MSKVNYQWFILFSPEFIWLFIIADWFNQIYSFFSAQLQLLRSCLKLLLNSVKYTNTHLYFCYCFIYLFVYVYLLLYVILNVFINLEFTLNQGRGRGKVAGCPGLSLDLRREDRGGGVGRDQLCETAQSAGGGGAGDMGGKGQE